VRTVHRILLGVGLAALVFLASCSQPGASSSTPPSPAQAQTITKNVVAALQAAMSGVKGTNPGKGLSAQTTYNGNGFSVSYTTSTSGTTNTYNVSITFTGYSYTYGSDTVVFNSGTATMVMTVDSSSGNISLVYNGNFNITYDGTPYTFSWNITYNYTGSTGVYTYTGTYTIDGQTYTWSG